MCGEKAISFTIELLRRQVLSPVFTNSDIITGLVYEHMPLKPVTVQRLDEKNTLLVFAESEDIGKICNTLQSIKMRLGNSITIGCNLATPKQVSMRDQLGQVGREEIVSVEGTNM